MTSAPKVSVLIPSYNGERFIAQAAGSILAQTFRDLELVVIDDGSSDGTRSILRRMAAGDQRMRVIEKDNEGLIATLNRGIAEARGALIARLDHDDVSLPDRIAAQIEFLDANPDFVGVGCLIENIDASGRVLRKTRIRDDKLVHDPLAFPPKQQWLYGPTPMIRAEVLRQAGGYRPQFVAAEDRDLCWRLGELGRMARLPRVLVQHRSHGGNMSLTKRAVQLYSAFLGDLSAIARGLGLDDGAIVERIEVGGDYAARIADYAQLIGSRYPVETYRLYFFLRFGAWGLAGFKSRGDAMGHVARHWAARPQDAARSLLLWRTPRFLRKAKKAEGGSAAQVAVS